MYSSPHNCLLLHCLLLAVSGSVLCIISKAAHHLLHTHCIHCCPVMEQPIPHYSLSLSIPHNSTPHDFSTCTAHTAICSAHANLYPLTCHTYSPGLAAQDNTTHTTTHHHYWYRGRLTRGSVQLSTSHTCSVKIIATQQHH